MTATVKLPGVSTPEKRKPGFFWVIVALLLPVWSLFVKYRFTPDSELPESGPFILSPNHMSELDPIAIGVAVWHRGRLPRFMAKASIFKVPFLGMIMRLSGQIPVERNSGLESTNSAKKLKAKNSAAPAVKRQTSAMAAAAQLIAAQSGVIVYPEGTLTRDPGLWPMRGKTGAVRLALESGIPLIPAAHWGVQQILPRYGKIRLWGRKQVAVAIGKPLDLSAFQGKPVTSEILNEATELLMGEITKLLETLRAEVAPTVRWDPKAHNQSEIGRF